MSYKPELTYCPACGTLKAPLATVCRDCYVKASSEAGRSTTAIKAWVAQQTSKAAHR